MQAIKQVYITGYRAFELGLFQEDDPKVHVLKKIIRRTIVAYLEQGVEWVLTAGNLGVEWLVHEVLLELKKEQEYPVQEALFLPFQEFGQKWAEKSQTKLNSWKRSVDYCGELSAKPYESPQQLRNLNEFLVGHSQGATLIYDPEFEGQPRYFYEVAQRQAEERGYEIQLITMDDLQNYEE